MKRTLSFFTAVLLLVCCSINIHALPVVTTQAEVNPFVIRHQSVKVEVYNHMIRTQVTQLVVNTGDEDVPCYFDLYLPDGAHASSLTAEVDGKKYVGRIEKTAVARAIVEESKQERKVAALAEEFPGRLHIEFSTARAGSEILFNVSYIEEAEYERGKFDYYFGVDKFNKELKVPDTFNMEISFNCTTAITSVESSTHTLIGDVNGEKAGFSVEDIAIIKKDFHMSYSLDLKPGIPNVMLMNRPKEDPYFCLLSLPPDAPVENTTRSLIFILDKSGSMEGDKFKLAVSSLLQFIEKLRPNDIFNVFIFDSGYTYCSPLPFVADQNGKAEAKKYIKKFSAQGGTYILGPTIDALEQLKFDDKNPTALVLLTDGQGSTSAPGFIQKVDSMYQFKVPMFVFAIGTDVNVPLLRSLSRYSGGSFSQVTKNDEIAPALAATRSRFDSICGFNLAVKTENKTGYFRVPRRLSHIYKDELIKVSGRLDANKEISLSIGADTKDGKWLETVKISTVENIIDCPFLDQGWGIGRIEELLDEDSNFGESKERTEEIIQLSIKYMISTRYTSFVFSELSEDRQNEIEEEMELEEMEDSMSFGAAGKRFGGKRRTRSKSHGGLLKDKDVKKEEMAKKLPKWYDETNHLLTREEKRMTNQIIAHSLLVYSIKDVKNTTATNRRTRSAVWLAVHSQEGVFSADLLEQVIATSALSGAKELQEGIEAVVKAAVENLKQKDFSTELAGKDNEYNLAVCLFSSILMTNGYDLSAKTKAILKSKIEEIVGKVDLSTIPYGKTFEEIKAWVNAIPVLAGFSNITGIEVSDEMLNIAAKATAISELTPSNIIYMHCWKHLVDSKRIKEIPGRIRSMGRIFFGKPNHESLFYKATGDRLSQILTI